jgi:hypothetical protein
MTFLRSRGAVAAIAACLLLWQALVVSLVAARSAALANGGYDAAFICHSDGSSGGSSNDPANDGQDCCAWCLVASTPTLPCSAAGASPIGQVSSAARLPTCESVAPLPRLIRAGWSQPPPFEA